MKNALEIVKSLGIELTEEQQQQLNAEISANYKTIAEFEKKTKKLEDDKTSLQAQIKSAEETLKSFEGVNVDEFNKKIADYQKKIEDIENGYKAKLEARDFDDILASSLNGVNFSSNLAKRAVMEDIKNAGLKVVNGRIMGLNDYLDELKKTDPTAFVAEAQPAKFTAPKNAQGEKARITKEDIMKITDTAERQKAIQDNIELFVTKK